MTLCPHDLAKLAEATGVGLAAHHAALAEFWAGRDAALHRELLRARAAIAAATPDGR